jgi:signal transduction histidine kinase
MDGTMATSAASTPLRRDPGRRVLGGVCAGLGERLGVDPLVVRVAFVAAAMAGGLGVALYLLAWAAIPAQEGAAVQRRVPTDRGSVEIAVGVALLTLSLLLAFRELGIWFSDAIVWPLVLVAAGGALLWRQSTRQAKPREPAPKKPVADRAATVSRTGLGVALVIAAGLAFLQATGSLVAARDVILAVLVVVIVLGVIFAPWILRLVRSLSAERAERIRSQERAEMAAHLHDSVLQTLALVQRADDPKQVSALARRQERELRAWLSGRTARAEGRLAAALEDAAADVEEAHGVAVDVVAVGDRDLDPKAEALVAAAREAMVNAAKFGGGSPVSVYAETGDGRAQVFVRDRGPGFDPSAIPTDRRGIRESIVGRMERHGGRATIASSGEGTEVELVLK